MAIAANGRRGRVQRSHQSGSTEMNARYAQKSKAVRRARRSASMTPAPATSQDGADPPQRRW